MTIFARSAPPAFEPQTVEPTATCLNCAAPLVGEYCATCGQRLVDLDAATWHVAKETVAEALDLDGRVLRTARALASPGRLTMEFLRGRRAPYVGPLKLFLLAGTALTTTWIATRGVDAHYYGFTPMRNAVPYIDAVVRGSLAAGFAIAVSSWALDGGRRRLLDDTIFALHLVTALALLSAAVTWVGTGWKLIWGTVAAEPRSMPSIVFLLFLPAAVAGLAYIVVAVRRVYGGRWWATVLRAVIITIVGALAIYGFILRTA